MMPHSKLGDLFIRKQPDVDGQCLVEWPDVFPSRIYLWSYDGDGIQPIILSEDVRFHAKLDPQKI
jgi:hypothetical protein